MADPRIFPNPTSRPTTLQAGIIKRIRLENFMCHTSLEIEFGEWVNFITGQNGSGKSAILTALCVAFGSRARGTQRANTLKDFIKTGCSYALVQVDIKNEGEDAFKPELYGEVIVVERRILESASTITLKDSQGRKVGTKRDDLREVTEHFNIDVENPCVIMSQDKSREFLHSGNSKDKFKATLLQHVDELLKGIEKQLNDAVALVDHLEKSLRPALKELDDLQEKIKSMEHVEEMRKEVQSVRRKLAWALVHDAEKTLAEKRKEIEKLMGRKPSCQQRIDMEHQKVEDLNNKRATKKCQIATMMEKTSELRRMKEDLQESYSMAMKEELELEGECKHTVRKIEAMVHKVELLEKQIQDFHEQNIMETQAEENKINEKIRELQVELDEAKANCQRLKIEEDEIAVKMLSIDNDLENISKQVEDAERSHRNISSRISSLRSDQTNKVTQFGGAKVTALLQAIEWHQHKFRKPPIGPIGAHVKLVNGDKWSIAVENAVGRLLNAFIVTDHQDSLTLRACAKEAKYYNLQIITYDFTVPRVNIPSEMLPQTHHPTVLSVLHSDNHTVLNVLIDVGSAERLVLVQDYDAGKSVVFEQKVANIKDAYTSDGSRMFTRGRSQNILPPYQRYGRLSSSFSNQIKDLERKAFEEKEIVQRCRGVKRSKEDELKNLRDMINSTKRNRNIIERQLRPKEFELGDLKKSQSKLAATAQSTDLDELPEQISMLRDQIQEKQIFLENIRSRLNEAQIKTKDANVKLGNMRESAKSDIEALSVAEKEMITIEEELSVAEAKKAHYEGLMNNRVLPEINAAEAEYQELEKKHKENHQKAAEKCYLSESETLEVRETTAEQLYAKLNRIEEKLNREDQRFQEPIDDLRMFLEKKQRKIFKKQQAYEAFREKLAVSETALDQRWRKFQRNAAQLAKQLTWNFGGHLRKKGVRGEIKVDYEQETLSVEVTMPHDASNSTVRDTRGLSGGERSFSTLCFALTLHEMTEAPFRAMDEFDVFMDAISRKISLDAVVDFAIAHGSQWIFITPHDISMVKNDERIKKQQMAAPRG